MAKSPKRSATADAHEKAEMKLMDKFKALHPRGKGGKKKGGRRK